MPVIWNVNKGFGNSDRYRCFSRNSSRLLVATGFILSSNGLHFCFQRAIKNQGLPKKSGATKTNKIQGRPKRRSGAEQIDNFPRRHHWFPLNIGNLMTRTRIFGHFMPNSVILWHLEVCKSTLQILNSWYLEIDFRVVGSMCLGACRPQTPWIHGTCRSLTPAEFLRETINSRPP